MQLIFKKTQLTDIDRIMEIITQAQQYFKDNNIDQWQNNYPNTDTIKQDITNGESYLAQTVDQNNLIVGTVVLSFEPEPTYTKIYEGAWLTNDEPYAVIHRLAVANDIKGRGISSFIMSQCESLCKDKNVRSIKIDTHRNNKSMLRHIEKEGYVYTGIIYLEDGAERVAYEKLVL